MKRVNYTKRAVIHGLSMAVFLGACLGVQAKYNDDEQKGVSTQAAVNGDTESAPALSTEYEGKLSRSDANFLKEAAQGGLLEVRLGQTAKDHGSSPEVKSFGEMLVKDHSKVNDQVAKLAGAKGVNLATEIEPKHTGMIKDLEKKAGPDFDREFVQHMIKDHRKDISRFEKASRELSDSELRAFAMETLPTFRAHLAEAERVAKSLGVNVTARNIDQPDNVDINREKDASVASKVEVETSKSDGKTLGVNTRKDDGKLLGVVPAPGRNKAGSRAGVDVDDRKLEVDANLDHDRDVKTLAFNEAPLKVWATIKAEGGSSELKVKKHTMNGKTVYKVEIPKEGPNRVLHIAEDGTIIKDNTK